MKTSKDELQNIIFGNEQTGPGSQLKKAQIFLRRYAEASSQIEKQQRFTNEETALLTFDKGNLLQDNFFSVNNFIALAFSAK